MQKKAFLSYFFINLLAFYINFGISFASFFFFSQFFFSNLKFFLLILLIFFKSLKPENVLIDKDGYIKLTDFGLSKKNIEGNTGAYSICGTPEYLAPEILKRVGHGKAADWWTFGALIYEMITGLPPFYTSNREILYDRILNEELQYPGNIDINLKRMLEGLFMKKPKERLGSLKVKFFLLIFNLFNKYIQLLK